MKYFSAFKGNPWQQDYPASLSDLPVAIFDVVIVIQPMHLKKAVTYLLRRFWNR
jgi:hypothetical protein